MILTPVKNTIKTGLLSLANNHWLKSLLSPWSNTVAIFCFHRILPIEEMEPEYHPNSEFTVSTDSFDKFLKDIARTHQLCSMDEVIEHLHRGSSEKIAHITFDDGYKDNLIHGVPLLEKNNAQATIYITTRFPEGDAWMWWHELWNLVLSKNSIVFSADKKPIYLQCESREEKRRTFDYLQSHFYTMDIKAQKNALAALTKLQQRPSYADLCLTWREIVQLSGHPLITIGAHSHSHPNLSVETDDSAAYELAHSKALLEAHLKKPIHHFAYPFGGYDSFGGREINIAKGLAYASAVTTICRKWNNDSIYELPRYYVTERSTPSILEARISGLCNLLGRQLV